LHGQSKGFQLELRVNSQVTATCWLAGDTERLVRDQTASDCVIAYNNITKFTPYIIFMEVSWL
jgi:hypothetical protein